MILGRILAVTLAAACGQAPPAPPPAPPAAPPGPDYAAHVATLRETLPDGFHVVVQPPFVVVGDESPRTVERHARRVVKWAVDLLKKDFFPEDPPEIIDVWLFKDADSYRANVRARFGEEPSTTFGYYSAQHRALIMDIHTGTGTLVHEIVHPFVRANFPECPAWLNEGLGSLYEQCHEKDGKIMGLTNWRLAGLQETIRAGRLPSFRELTAGPDRRFYGMDKGSNYAQARYLCYWLQEHGLLRRFYRAFHAARAKDPTGYATLQAILEREDMEAFQREWETWVLGLIYESR